MNVGSVVYKFKDFRNPKIVSCNMIFTMVAVRWRPFKNAVLHKIMFYFRMFTFLSKYLKFKIYLAKILNLTELL